MTWSQEGERGQGMAEARSKMMLAERPSGGNLIRWNGVKDLWKALQQGLKPNFLGTGWVGSHNFIAAALQVEGVSSPRAGTLLFSLQIPRAYLRAWLRQSTQKELPNSSLNEGWGGAWSWHLGPQAVWGNQQPVTQFWILLNRCRQTATGSDRNQRPIFEAVWKALAVFHQQKKNLGVQGEGVRSEDRQGPQKPTGLPSPLGTHSSQAEMDSPWSWCSFWFRAPHLHRPFQAPPRGVGKNVHMVIWLCKICKHR